MESSSPNYRTHPEAFQDSQDPYDMWQIRQNDRRTTDSHDKITIHKHAGQKDPKKIVCSDRLLLLLKILSTE